MVEKRQVDPEQRERRKSVQQKAEDIIYTLNHAITCLSVTDLLVAPFIGAVTEKLFGKRIDICGHDHKGGEGGNHGGGHEHHDHHAHDHDHDHHGHEHHDHHAHDHKPKRNFFHSARDWIVGEFVGDVGAVPVTIATQRMFPGFMDGIRRVLEPMVGGVFRSGAKRAAESWADKNGFARDSDECRGRAHKLYEYEVSHLPQMTVWTLSSVLINFGIMKLLNRNMDVGTFMKGKAAGAGVTAGLVFGVRALDPNLAHSWDETAGKHVVVPLTKTVGKLFGIEEEEVDRVARRREEVEDTQKARRYEGRLDTAHAETKEI